MGFVLWLSGPAAREWSWCAFAQSGGARAGSPWRDQDVSGRILDRLLFRLELSRAHAFPLAC
jgi:hypothetical protein